MRPVRTATVPSIDTGICHVMVLEQSRIMNPTSSNRALTSLGFDPVMYKKDFGTNPKPSMKLILAKVLG